MKFKFDKDIPLSRKMSGRTNAHNYMEMDVGDSVLINEKKLAKSFIAAFRLFMKKYELDREITQREVKGGLRIWRTK